MRTLGTRFKRSPASNASDSSWFVRLRLIILAFLSLLWVSSPARCCRAADDSASGVWTLRQTLLHPNALEQHSDNDSDNYFTDVAYHPTRPQLAAATASGRVHLAARSSSSATWTWQTTPPSPPWTVNPLGRPVRRVRYNPAGTRFATASDDGTVRVWNVVSNDDYDDGGGDLWTSPSSSQSAVLTMATVPAAGDGGGAAVVALPQSLAWHPSGRYLAAAGQSMGVEVWEVAEEENDDNNSWQSVAALPLVDDDDNDIDDDRRRRHHHLDWSPDGTQLVVDGAVYWWIPPSLSPRGQLFAAASNDNGTATFWTRPQWSPDGTLVAAVSSSSSSSGGAATDSSSSVGLVGISDAYFGSTVAEWSLDETTTTAAAADNTASLQWRPIASEEEEEGEPAPGQLLLAGATSDRAFLWSAGRNGENSSNLSSDDWSSSRRTVVELPYSSSGDDTNNNENAVGGAALAWRPDGQQLAIAHGGAIDVWDHLAAAAPSSVVQQQPTVSPTTTPSPATSILSDAPPPSLAPTRVPLENIVETESATSEDSPATAVATSSPSDRGTSIIPKTPADPGNNNQQDNKASSSSLLVYAVPPLIVLFCCGCLLLWRYRQQHSSTKGAFPSNNNDSQSGQDTSEAALVEEVVENQPVTVETSIWDDRRINQFDDDKHIDAACVCCSSTCESHDMTETTVSSFDGEDPTMHCDVLHQHTIDVVAAERTAPQGNVLLQPRDRDCRISSILDRGNEADDEREEGNLARLVASTDDEESSRGWTSNSNSSFFIDGDSTTDDEFGFGIV